MIRTLVGELYWEDPFPVLSQGIFRWSDVVSLRQWAQHWERLRRFLNRNEKLERAHVPFFLQSRVPTPTYNEISTCFKQVWNKSLWVLKATGQKCRYKISQKKHDQKSLKYVQHSNSHRTYRWDNFIDIYTWPNKLILTELRGGGKNCWWYRGITFWYVNKAFLITACLQIVRVNIALVECWQNKWNTRCIGSNSQSQDE